MRVKERYANKCGTGGNFWLKNWAEHNAEYGGNPNVGMYLGVYFGIGIGSAALVVVQTLILWIFCSVEVRPPHSCAVRRFVCVQLHSYPGMACSGRPGDLRPAPLTVDCVRRPAGSYMSAWVSIPTDRVLRGERLICAQRTPSFARQ